ncbi:MAG: hypothetical protein AAF791_05445 [Bacteroidota bacterium]
MAHSLFLFAKNGLDTADVEARISARLSTIRADDIGAVPEDTVGQSGGVAEHDEMDQRLALKANVSDVTRYLGAYADAAARDAANPTPPVGSTADVDGGPGNPVERYIYDADDGWVLQQGTTTAETETSVKQKYESNPDTNAFTDAQQSKLGGVEAQATRDDAASVLAKLRENDDVNVVTDAEASKIDNLPPDTSDTLAAHQSQINSLSGQITGLGGEGVTPLPAGPVDLTPIQGDGAVIVSGRRAEASGPYHEVRIYRNAGDGGAMLPTPARVKRQFAADGSWRVEVPVPDDSLPYRWWADHVQIAEDGTEILSPRTGPAATQPPSYALYESTLLLAPKMPVPDAFGATIPDGAVADPVRDWFNADQNLMRTIGSEFRHYETGGGLGSRLGFSGGAYVAPLREAVSLSDFALIVVLYGFSADTASTLFLGGLLGTTADTVDTDSDDTLAFRLGPSNGNLQLQQDGARETVAVNDSLGLADGDVLTVSVVGGVALVRVNGAQTEFNSAPFTKDLLAAGFASRTATHLVWGGLQSDGAANAVGATTAGSVLRQFSALAVLGQHTEADLRAIENAAAIMTGQPPIH